MKTTIAFVLLTLMGTAPVMAAVPVEPTGSFAAEFIELIQSAWGTVIAYLGEGITLFPDVEPTTGEPAPAPVPIPYPNT